MPTVGERVLSSVMLYLLFFGSYGLANRLIPLSRCGDLTTSWDRSWPFLPGFVFFFYLAYVLMLAPAVLLARRDSLRRAFVSFAALIVSSCVLFVLVPVHVPRPFDVPPTLAGRLVENIYAHDLPVCGFPSLHVSGSVLAGLIVWRERRWPGAIVMFFAVLASLATLFIKQHVILDVAGGVVLAAIASCLTRPART